MDIIDILNLVRVIDIIYNIDTIDDDWSDKPNVCNNSIYKLVASI